MWLRCEKEEEETGRQLQVTMRTCIAIGKKIKNQGKFVCLFMELLAFLFFKNVRKYTPALQVVSCVGG